MKNFSFLILCSIISLVEISSQPTLQWAATYRGPGNWIDDPQKIVLIGTDIYVTGHSFGEGTFADFCTIKYNESGSPIWIQRYNGPENYNDYARFIHRCRNGGLYVIGRTSTEQYSASRIVKYSEGGELIWVKEFLGMNYWSGAVDSSDNIFICGLTGFSPNIDFKVSKFDTSGNLVWTKEYAGPGNFNDEPLAAGVDLNGNIFITGYTTSGEFTRNRDILTLKYLSNGTLSWERIYNAPANDFDAAYNLSIDYDNNVVVSGWSNRGYNNDQDMIAIKYSNSGDLVWVNRYNGSGNYTDCVRATVIDPDNNCYVSGYVYNNNITGTDFCTIKYNAEGHLLWVRTYSGFGAGIDGVDAIALDEYSNLYVTGSSWGNGTNYDFATLQYDSSGNEKWSARYSTEGNFEDHPSDIKIDNLGNVIVTGEGKNMYVTLKYSQPIGIFPGASIEPDVFSLSQNYPNPFNPVTNIKFDIPKSGLVKITVYDLLGREVTALVNESLQPGSYNVDWDASNYPSGVYFYILESGDYFESKKMILIK